MAGFNRHSPVFYAVWVKQDAPAPAETAEFVREGFNFYAFIFGVLWAFYHRAWALALSLVAANIVISVAEAYGVFNPMQAMFLQLFIQLWLGFEANDQLQHVLQKRGYLLVDMVAGDTPLRAQLRFLERYFARLSSQPAPATATLTPSAVGGRSPWANLMPHKGAE